MTEPARAGCDLCRTPKYPSGRPFCARCRPAPFAREVTRLRAEIERPGGAAWRCFDEANPRTFVLDVPVPRA